MATIRRYFASALAVSAALLLAAPAAAESDPEPPVETIGRLRATVKRAADRPGQPIVEVRLGVSDATDDDLVALAGLAELRVLDLSFTRVTDAGLSHLVGLKNLQSLHLHGLNITDEGLGRLKVLPALRELVATGPITWGNPNRSITDAGMAHLKAVRTPESLHVGSAAITDAGLAHLKGLARLRSCRSAGPA